VAAALAESPDACGVFLVEPSFVGVLSDVPGIAALAHRAGVPLVIDQAWGAHFGFHPAVPPHALAAGADAFVASSHKTLAAFTQSAFLLARGGFLDLERLEESFELLHTTSVSAALLASIDRARMIMATRGEELLAETVRLAAYARERLAEVDGLIVVASNDPTKLALALPGTGADGLEVEADLFAQGIRFELANRDLLVPLLTIADTEEGVERLCDALVASFAARRGEPRPPGGASAVWNVTPETALTPREAFFSPRETVAAADAAGRIAAEMVCPYPPGIPAIAPGEVVTSERLAALRDAAAHGTRLAYCADSTLASLRVVGR
jgi:lysine decarboxylase